MRPLDEHDESHDGKRHDDDPQNDECRELSGPAELEQAAEGCGQARHDTGEYDERDAVADAARGDLLAEPHEEHGAAR